MAEPPGAVRPSRVAGAVAAGLWLILLLLWLRSIVVQTPPTPVERLVVAGAPLATLAWLALRLIAALRGGRERARRALLATGLAAAALALGWTGIDHELDEHYYEDEGIYYSHATRINDGEIFRPRFVYPHLLFYLDALVLWCGERLPGAVATLSRLLAGGVEGPTAEWLLLRLAGAALGALTVLPVFAAGARLAGAGAGLLGALLMLFSPLYQEGFHVNTSDVPSAFFAAVCLAFVARLIRRERGLDYLAAGVASGLAAGAKYPAGVVAVAIVAVWLKWRISERRWSWQLVAAGAASLATFLAVNPSFFVFPEVALEGRYGVLFGWRQYGEGGWIGVVPGSNLAYYASLLRFGFGVPAIVAGVAGCLLLPARRRRHLAWLAVFPVVYLALMVAMSMVVVRNVYPALPGVAVVLGAGIAALANAAGRRPTAPWARRLVFIAIAGAALALPVYRTVAGAVGFARESTRELAERWAVETLPAGATILKEGYTPHLRGKPFEIVERRFAAWVPMEEVRSGAYDFAILSPRAYDRFLDRSYHLRPDQERYARWYEEALAEFEPLARFWPTPWRRGPRLQVFRIPRRDPQLATRRRFAAAEAFVSSRTMRKTGDPGLTFRRPTQWALFREDFAAGVYRVVAEGSVAAPGRVIVVGGPRLERRERPLDAAGGATIELPDPGRHFLYLLFDRPGRLTAVEVARQEGGGG
ncbi:MAG: glycosyltransferase family 39 protein [Thermoanaerobaculia bacterium]|nr:glycosyltransferase family 39 protein [Thermoanaerobaculia bacterium]